MAKDLLSALGADRFFDTVDNFLNSTNAVSLTFGNILIACVILAVFLLGLGMLFRLAFGPKSAVNRAISGFVNVLFIYAFTVVIYTLKPWNFAQYLSPLPFAYFRHDILILSSSAADTFSLLASQILSLIILCFIIHFLNFLLPSGQSFLTWFILRLLSAVLAIFLNLTAAWALNTFLPGVVATYAPAALLGILAVALVVSLFNPLLCIIFTVANPVIGILYTFFFSNTIGKNLTRAVLSAGLTCGLFYCLERFGFAVIDITSHALLTYVPFSVILLGIWYVFDHKL